MKNRINNFIKTFVLHAQELTAVSLFHHRTCTAYLYDGCLAWYNILITSQVHSSVKSQIQKVQQTKYIAADSSDGRISVLNRCLSWSKLGDTHLYHSRQWFNIHLINYNEEINHTTF